MQVDSDDFEALGQAFEATGAVRSGRIGAAHCRLFAVRAAVEFAVAWLRTNRESAAGVWTDEQRKERAPASD